ncbi:MAG TPA: hypothetical protein VGF28_18180 [Thermoanaerobaculia bacterium]|jgi:hypothetical protein
MTVVLAGLLLTQAAHACQIFVLEPAQVLVRRADVVVETVARADPNAFEVTKVWKGNGPAVLATKIADHPCDPAPEIITGERYLLLITADQPATAFTAETAPRLLKYLENPERVTANDLLRILRDWQAGTVTDDAMAWWIQSTAPVADVDDWLKLDDREEVSLVLRVLEELHHVVNRPEAPLSEVACELRGIRQQLVPFWIRVLSNPPKTLEEYEALENLPEEEVLGDQRCSGS